MYEHDDVNIKVFKFSIVTMLCCVDRLEFMMSEEEV